MGMYSEKPILDMTPDGRFRSPQKPPFAVRIAAVALVIAVVAGGLAAAAFALWLVFMLIPVVLVAGLIGYAALRFQVRRSSFRGTGHIVYPPDSRRP
jgi:fatty acid desaturase